MATNLMPFSFSFKPEQASVEYDLLLAYLPYFCDGQLGETEEADIGMKQSQEPTWPDFEVAAHRKVLAWYRECAGAGLPAATLRAHFHVTLATAARRPDLHSQLGVAAALGMLRGSAELTAGQLRWLNHLSLSLQRASPLVWVDAAGEAGARLPTFLGRTEPWVRSRFHDTALESGLEELGEFGRYFIEKATALMELWERQEAQGAAPRGTSDKTFHRHQRVVWFPAGANTEVFVIGDLHGCYANLRAVLWQSDVVSKLERGEDVYLVCIGDYVDRGKAEFPGVLPLLIELNLRFPERVLLLQGNHELYATTPASPIVATCRPSDTLDYWRGEVIYDRTNVLGDEFWIVYRRWTEHLLLMAFSQHGDVFAHAGVPPRDVVVAANNWGQLGGQHLEPTERLRCQQSLLWLDPEETDPEPNRRPSVHGPFGPTDLEALLDKAGMFRLIRGHVGVDRGAEESLGGLVLTVHSTGGPSKSGRAHPHVLEGYESPSEARYLRLVGNVTEAHTIDWETVLRPIQVGELELWM